MVAHIITLPDWQCGDEPRTILWDDEVGTYSDLPDIRRAPRRSETCRGRRRRLRLEPERSTARSSGKFFVLLYIAHWPAPYPPLRETLPPVFDDVSMAPGEPDEDLYDERGKRLV